MILKIILMCVFFVEVVFFGRIISGLNCFKNGNVMDLALTFSGTLFLSIALIDIIPQAITNFDLYFSQNQSQYQSSSSLHQNAYLPLTLIISMVTFMVIMYIDKIMIGHSHDHTYEVSFMNQPKVSEQGSVRNEANPQPEPSPHGLGTNDQMADSGVQKPKKQFDCRPFILQIGLSIHAFFETLAVGLQDSPVNILSLASAILVHKWAEGLTLSLIYRKQNISQRTIKIMIFLQGTVNVLGLLTGSFLMGQGAFVTAFFMSLSAGTFFYISLAQVLQEQMHKISKMKMVMVVVANIFIAFIVWFEKHQEQAAEDTNINLL